MNENLVVILLLSVPAVAGGVIAFINSEKINRLTERIEAWLRRRRGINGIKKGFFSRWVVRPPLWFCVKLCDWTDSLAHRGVKNGIRTASAMYVLGLWTLFAMYAFVAVLALVCGALILVVVFMILGQVLGGNQRSSRERERESEELPAGGAVVRNKRFYSGTSWFNEELEGRVDEKGNIYRGTHWTNEEKIGRFDDDGNVFRGTGFWNEEAVGRVDEDGNLIKGTNWWNEEKVGRIDEKGDVYKGTNWWNEEKKGRMGD